MARTDFETSPADIRVFSSDPMLRLPMGLESAYLKLGNAEGVRIAKDRVSDDQLDADFAKVNLFYSSLMMKWIVASCMQLHLPEFARAMVAMPSAIGLLEQVDDRFELKRLDFPKPTDNQGMVKFINHSFLYAMGQLESGEVSGVNFAVFVPHVELKTYFGSIPEGMTDENRLLALAKTALLIKGLRDAGLMQKDIKFQGPNTVDFVHTSVDGRIYMLDVGEMCIAPYSKADNLYRDVFDPFKNPALKKIEDSELERYIGKRDNGLRVTSYAYSQIRGEAYDKLDYQKELSKWHLENTARGSTKFSPELIWRCLNGLFRVDQLFTRLVEAKSGLKPMVSSVEDLNNPNLTNIATDVYLDGLTKTLAKMSAAVSGS